jgi:NAD(P)H-hydrate epimerase
MNSLNDNKKLIDELANLLNETAEAHHKAFAATEGEDPDWPIWYADYLLDKMRQMLNAKFTKSELIYLLVSAEKKNRVVAPGAYWPRFYANFIISRYM